jgi:tellurium resistance protein TerZ
MTAISLVKGQKINLQKGGGGALTKFCAGANWGAHPNGDSIDLDLHAAMFTEDKQLIEHIFFGNLNASSGAIKHSGDDLVGDVGGDDGLDNEILTMDFSKLPSNCSKVAIFLCSFRGDDFAIVPHAEVRIYEGTPDRVSNVVASYKIGKDPSFSGSVVMVMGIFYKHNSEWKFNAVGTPTRDQSYSDALTTIKSRLL